MAGYGVEKLVDKIPYSESGTLKKNQSGSQGSSPERRAVHFVRVTGEK